MPSWWGPNLGNLANIVADGVLYWLQAGFWVKLNFFFESITNPIKLCLERQNPKSKPIAFDSPGEPSALLDYLVLLRRTSRWNWWNLCSRWGWLVGEIFSTFLPSKQSVRKKLNQEFLFMINLNVDVGGGEGAGTRSPRRVVGIICSEAGVSSGATRLFVAWFARRWHFPVSIAY
jgi:hypothetical protein